MDADDSRSIRSNARRSAKQPQTRSATPPRLGTYPVVSAMAPFCRCPSARFELLIPREFRGQGAVADRAYDDATPRSRRSYSPTLAASHGIPNRKPDGAAHGTSPEERALRPRIEESPLPTCDDWCSCHLSSALASLSSDRVREADTPPSEIPRTSAISRYRKPSARRRRQLWSWAGNARRTAWRRAWR